MARVWIDLTNPAHVVVLRPLVELLEAGGHEVVLTAAWDVCLDHVVAVAMPDKAASRRVMEKLGMSLEGPARYRDLDVVRYSISRPD